MMERIAIIGVGLIGGSVALAARAGGLARTVVGVDANADNLRTALDLGVIDHAYDDAAEAARGCDLVLIATPVGAIEAVLHTLQPAWAAGRVYSDAGSTKGSVIAAARRVFGRVPANFVPGHPIAGAERSGVEAASAELYRGRRVILTPLAETDPAALQQVETFWSGLGARVSHMPPDQHDAVLAATSHLPHVLAFVLADLLGHKDRQGEIFQYAAGGFRDFTRIASSDPTMWLDICLANGEAIVPLLEEYRDALGNVADWIANRATGELRALFTGARAARQRFLNQVEQVEREPDAA
ncbi:prephenate dehydrogenase [Candidatus Methylocalor cossyra]|uniref:Prephenate dehydrogenase n=1 Tax=Candidatus Methylocalor cossyra TaxID=3108543 RepID=A0ABM9NM65_9GAMM